MLFDITDIHDAFFFAIVFAVSGLLAVLNLYFLVTLVDLDHDLLNAGDCCNKLNNMVPLKTRAHIILCIILAVRGEWSFFFFNLPMLTWLIFERARRYDDVEVYDPVEILFPGEIRRHVKFCLICAGHYVVFSLIYVYLMIASIKWNNWEGEKDPEFHYD